MRGQLVGDLESSVERLAGRNALGHETASLGLCRVEATYEEDELLRLRRPDHPHEPMRSAGAGEDAECDLGQPEDRGLVDYAEVHGEGELERAAEAPAVDRGDGRHRQRGEPLVDVPGRRVVRGDRLGRALAELAD